MLARVSGLNPNLPLLVILGLDAYLDELEWRFNNREDPYLFRDTLLKLIQSENLPYQRLIQQ